MGITIIHTADLHLGKKHDTLPKDTAKHVAEKQFDTLRRIIELADKNNAAAILISGDLFDSPAVQEGVSSRAAAILGGTDIPVFISPGNHDFYSPPSPYNRISWPGNVYIFNTREIEKYDLGDFVVYGAAFRSQTVTDSLLKGFRNDDPRPSFMALHSELNASSPRFSPITTGEIAESGLTYLALGHTHQRSEIKTAGSAAYAFSGCPQGSGFDETGEKGVYLITYDDKLSAEFIPIPAPQFRLLEVELSASEDPAETILDRLPPDSREHLYKISLTGELAMSHEVYDKINGLLSGHVLFSKLTDNTRLPKVIWESAEEDSLKGLFISMLKQRAESGAYPEELIERAARFGIAALDGEEI
ncbi:MAG: metallophosphoesterase [Oscillospiraceae bacterium]|nr:metallophosphoesterase [Oscillospiraceae bacterium]